MTDIDEYTRLKTEVDKLKKKKERAEGALEQLLKRMKEVIGVSTVNDAKRVFVGLQAKEKEAEECYHEALKDFDFEWGAKLEGVE